MNKILSQDEINQLLSSYKSQRMVDSTGEDLREVQPYDFKHPERISKDMMRSMRTIHEGLARSMGTHLSSTMRLMAEINLLSMDQVTYAEYTMSLPELSCLYVLTSDKISGSVIVELSPQFVLYMVDRLLGGVGDALSEPREITVIEQNVIARMVNQLIRTLNEVWSMLFPMDFKLEGFETNPQFVQIAPASETVAVVFFEIRVRSFTFPMNICMPYFVLEPALPYLNQGRRLSMTDRRGDREIQLPVMHKVLCGELELSALLGRTEISLSDFLELQRGDILPLAVREHAEIELRVGDRTKFLGRPGLIGRRKGFRITRSLDPFEDPIWNESA
jgi:flagellar motor switch protein FliM